MARTISSCSFHTIGGALALSMGLGGCGEDPDRPEPADDVPESTAESGSTRPTAETGSTGDTGEPTATVPDPGTGNLPASAVRWHGDDPYDRAGYSLDLAEVLAEAPGDEVLVGTPSDFLYDPVDRYGGDAGAYLLLSDAPSGVLDDAARTFFVPTFNGDYWGAGVVGLGDITGDGEADVVVGGAVGGSPYLAMPIYSGHRGGDVVFGNAAAWWMEGSHPTGTAMIMDGVRACGDVDGDSFVDLCSQTIPSGLPPGEVSEAIVLQGPIRGPYRDEDASIRLQAPWDERAGRFITSADFDGDGLGDLLVGAYKRDGGNGGAYLATGLAPGTVWLPDGPSWTGEGGQAGQTVAAGGDLDGDGRIDGFVGAPHLDERTGRGYVLVDDAGGPLASAYATFEGAATHDWLGMAAAMGDLDGDGSDDLAVGIPRDIYFGFDRPGRVAVFAGPLTPGSHTEADAVAVWSAHDLPDAFGHTLDIGDVDDDGRGDLLIGAPYASVRREGDGAVVLLLGGGL